MFSALGAGPAACPPIQALIPEAGERDRTGAVFTIRSDNELSGLRLFCALIGLSVRSPWA